MHGCNVLYRIHQITDIRNTEIHKHTDRQTDRDTDREKE